jgi:hypothetical protein
MISRCSRTQREDAILVTGDRIQNDVVAHPLTHAPTQRGAYLGGEHLTTTPPACTRLVRRGVLHSRRRRFQRRSDGEPEHGSGPLRPFRSWHRRLLSTQSAMRIVAAARRPAAKHRGDSSW